MLTHTISPIYDEHSAVLILGSFPSVRSREVGFFYGHPQNRFWRVLASVFETPVPEAVKDKTDFLLHHHIALWDVAASCDIQGSSDSTLTHVVPNDLTPILATAPIRRIFVNGATAARYYERLIRPQIGREATLLPSTSPANATWSLDRLVEAWRIILEIENGPEA